MMIKKNLLNSAMKILNDREKEIITEEDLSEEAKNIRGIK